MADKKFVGHQLTVETIDNQYLRKETIIDYNSKKNWQSKIDIKIIGSQKTWLEPIW